MNHSLKQRILAGASVLLVALPSCGALADDVAATVNGTDISVADVAELADSSYVAGLAQANNVGLISAAEGTTGSARQRLALSQLVQAELYGDAVEDLGDEVSEEDRQAAEQQISAYEEANGAFDPPTRETLMKLVAGQSALVRVLSPDVGLEPTDAEIEEFFNANRDQFGVLTCVDGFAVAAAAGATAQDLIDGGATVEELLTNVELGAQPLSQDGSETCVPPGQVADPTLGSLIDDGPVGEWGRGELTDPQQGDLVVFIRPNSRGEATPQTPSVAAQIAEALSQEAQAEAQAAVSEHKFVLQCTF